MDVKTKCLGMLFLGDATGYEIKKSFEEGEFSHFLQGSFGSIYPALASLAEEGLITSMPVEGESGQENRREKKLYRITDQGRTTLLKKITGQPAPDKFNSEFLFQLIFAPHVSGDLVRLMLDQRERDERDSADRLLNPQPNEVMNETPAETFIRLFGARVHKASAEFIAEHRYLLEQKPEKETHASTG